MTRSLLDTHAFLWWLAGDERLSRAARKAMSEDAGSSFRQRRVYMGNCDEAPLGQAAWRERDRRRPRRRRRVPGVRRPADHDPSRTGGWRAPGTPSRSIRSHADRAGDARRSRTGFERARFRRLWRAATLVRRRCGAQASQARLADHRVAVLRDGAKGSIVGAAQCRERNRIMCSRTAWLRAAVLGANDGIISTASLIMGVAAATGARGRHPDRGGRGLGGGRDVDGGGRICLGQLAGRLRSARTWRANGARSATSQPKRGRSSPIFTKSAA